MTWRLWTSENQRLGGFGMRSRSSVSHVVLAVFILGKTVPRGRVPGWRCPRFAETRPYLHLAAFPREGKRWGKRPVVCGPSVTVPDNRQCSASRQNSDRTCFHLNSVWGWDFTVLTSITIDEVQNTTAIGKLARKTIGTRLRSVSRNVWSACDSACKAGVRIAPLCLLRALQELIAFCV